MNGRIESKTRFVRAAAAGVGVVAVIGALAAPGSAQAAPGSPSSDSEQPAHTARLVLDGDLTMGGLHLLNIDAQGQRDQQGKTQGTYVATVMDGRHKTPFQVKGPVTCIYTHGDTASLIYPITGTTPDLVPAPVRGAFAVKISVRKGAVNQVGVDGPMPTDSFHGCAPGPTPNTFSGKITID